MGIFMSMAMHCENDQEKGRKKREKNHCPRPSKMIGINMVRQSSHRLPVADGRPSSVPFQILHLLRVCSDQANPISFRRRWFFDVGLV